MASNSRKTRTPRDQGGEKWILAAQMTARAEKTNQQVCAELGISVARLWGWQRNDPEFIAEVERIRAEFRAAMIERGIADKMNRLAKYEDLIRRMYQVIGGRAESATVNIVDPKQSGLIAHDVKFGKTGEPIDIGRFDKGLVSEIREVLKQAAIEVGDWNEKREISGPNGGPITFLDLVKAAASDTDEPE